MGQYVDYDVISATTGVGADFVGGDDGEQWLHTDFPSPLTNQPSLYARAFMSKGQTFTTGRQNLFLIKESAIGSMTGAPDYKTTTAIAWLQQEGPGSEQVGGHSIGPLIKGATQDFGVPGYYLGLGQGVTGSSQHTTNGSYLGLRIADEEGANPTSYTDIGTIVPWGTWVQVKLEVVPTDLGGGVDRDIVNAYQNTGTEVSPIWTLIQTHTVLDSDPQWHPWGNTTNCRVGFFAEDQETIVNGGGANIRSFISSFESHVTITP